MQTGEHKTLCHKGNSILDMRHENKNISGELHFSEVHRTMNLMGSVQSQRTHGFSSKSTNLMGLVQS